MSVVEFDSTYEVKSHDGHKIGIVTSKKVKHFVHYKTGKKFIIEPETEPIFTCGAAYNLTVNAICCITLIGSSGAYQSCDLYTGWWNTGGECLAVYINNAPYKDGNSEYGLWGGSTNGIACEAPLIAGGIVAGQIKNVFIRTYCNADTTGSAHFDTPVNVYPVPPSFVCAGSSPVMRVFCFYYVPPKPNGKKKK